MDKKERVGIHSILAAIYFLAIPLTITLSSGGSSYLKLLAVPIAGYFLITVVFYREKLEFNSVHLFYVLYIVSAIMTLFIAHDSLSIDYVAGHVENLALMLLLTVRKYNDREIRLIEDVQVLLLMLLVWAGLFGGATYAERTTVEVFGGVSDPNYFCGFFILPMAVCLKNVAEGRFRILNIALLVLGGYVVLLTGSRGGLLAVGATLFAFVFFYAKNIRKLIVYLCISVVAVVLFWNVFLPLLPDNIVERLTVEAVVESRGTSRVDIWLSMLSEIGKSGSELLTGRGINAEHVMFILGEEQAVVAHNTFIQMLYNQGIPGLFIFLGLVSSGIFRNIRKRRFIAVAIVGMLVLMMSLSVNPNIKTFWNLIMYAALSDTRDSGKGVDSPDEQKIA